MQLSIVQCLHQFLENFVKYLHWLQNHFQVFDRVVNWKNNVNIFYCYCYRIQISDPYTIMAQQTLTKKSKRFSSANTESQMRTTSGNGNSCDSISVNHRKL